MREQLFWLSDAEWQRIEPLLPPRRFLKRSMRFNCAPGRARRLSCALRHGSHPPEPSRGVPAQSRGDVFDLVSGERLVESPRFLPGGAIVVPAKVGIQTAVGGCFLDPAFAGVTSFIVAVSPPGYGSQSRVCFGRHRS